MVGRKEELEDRRKRKMGHVDPLAYASAERYRKREGGKREEEDEEEGRTRKAP